MRILPIFLFIFSCAACGQELNNPNMLKLCPENQTVRFHNCWGTYIVNGVKYVGEFKDDKRHGQGTNTLANGNKYVGEFKNDQPNGQGNRIFADGDKYVGEEKDGKKHGQGTYTFANGRVEEGIWSDDKFVRAEKINLPPVNQQTDVAINEELRRLDSDRQSLEQERKRLEEDKRQREQANNSNVSPDKK